MISMFGFYPYITEDPFSKEMRPTVKTSSAFNNVSPELSKVFSYSLKALIKQLLGTVSILRVFPLSSIPDYHMVCES